MKVKELKEKLENLPDNMEVVVDDTEDDWVSLDSMFVEKRKLWEWTNGGFTKIRKGSGAEDIKEVFCIG